MLQVLRWQRSTFWIWGLMLAQRRSPLSKETSPCTKTLGRGPGRPHYGHWTSPTGRCWFNQKKHHIASSHGSWEVSHCGLKLTSSTHWFIPVSPSKTSQESLLRRKQSAHMLQQFLAEIRWLSGFGNLLNGSGSISKKSFTPVNLLPITLQTTLEHITKFKSSDSNPPIFPSKILKKNKPSQRGLGKTLGIPIFPRKTHRANRHLILFFPCDALGSIDKNTGYQVHHHLGGFVVDSPSVWWGDGLLMVISSPWSNS